MLCDLSGAIDSAKILNIESEDFDNHVAFDWKPNGNNERDYLRISELVDFAELLVQSIDSKLIHSLIDSGPNNATLEILSAFGEKLSHRYTECKDGESTFTNLTKLDLESWTSHSGKSLSGLIQRLQYALASTSLLTGWIDYIRTRHVLDQFGITNLADQIETKGLSHELAHIALRAAIYDLLARVIYRTEPEVTSFVGYAHTECQKRFAEVDRQLLQLQAERIAYKADKNKVPHGNSRGAVGEYTDCHLVQWEIQKRKGTFPLGD